MDQDFCWGLVAHQVSSRLLSRHGSQLQSSLFSAPAINVSLWDSRIRRLRPVSQEEQLGLVEDYRKGLLPLIVPLTLLKYHLNRYPVPEWVQQQVYLHPYPEEMTLRNQVSTEPSRMAGRRGLPSLTPFKNPEVGTPLDSAYKLVLFTRARRHSMLPIWYPCPVTLL